MSRNVVDSRQVTLRQFLQQIANSSTYAGTADAKPANQSELDNLLKAIDDELTPPLRLSANDPNSLIVNVGAAIISNTESARSRSISHIGALLPNSFTSGTVTFPSASGGTITVSPGNNGILTVASGNYIKVLIYMDATGALNVLPGVENAVEATASVLAAPKKTLPIGYVTLQNVAGTIQNVAQSKIYQFGSGSGSASSSGSGIGDDLVALTFKASFLDDFEDIPSGSASAVDITAGKTDSTLYSAANAYYRLAYDASKTVAAATTTTNLNISASASFTVKVGDIAIYGAEARRITAVATQASFTTEAFSVAPTLAGQVTISQAVYTLDINNLALDGSAIATAFPSSISQILCDYEDTTTADDIIFDANTTPVIAFSASTDGTSYTNVSLRPTNLVDSMSIVNTPTSGTNLYIRFFANKTSSSGFVNILKYKTFLHRDSSYLDGTLMNQAYAFTDGVGTEINCSAPSVVSGKTRLTVTFTYPVAVNAGTTNGALKVYLNGQKIPRYVDATLTPDASYREISTSTIELDGDYSALNYSLEVIQDTSVVDSSETNSASIDLINTSKLQNQLMNGAFDLWQRGTSVTVANTVSTYLADRWYVKNSLGTNGVITYSQQAGSVSGSKYGAKVQITTAPTAAQTNGTELYQVIENMNTLSLLDKIMSASVYIKSFGNVNQVGIQFYYKTTEAKVDTALGTEVLVSVNSSSFVLGSLLAQSINSLPTSAGVLGIRIRITGVSSGNTHDINNGFIVEQAMMNIGIMPITFKRRGDSIREEIQDCQRYYEKSYDNDVAPGTVSSVGTYSGFNAVTTGVAIRWPLVFKIQKRTNTPSITFYNPTTGGTGTWRDSGANNVAMTANNTGMNSTAASFTSVAANATIDGHFTADSEI